MLFAFFGSVACGAEEHVVFSQPDVSDIGDRVYVIERRPLGEWFMISWQKSPFTADGKFVPVDWDPGEKTGLSIPDERSAQDGATRHAKRGRQHRVPDARRHGRRLSQLRRPVRKRGRREGESPAGI